MNFTASNFHKKCSLKGKILKMFSDTKDQIYPVKLFTCLENDFWHQLSLLSLLKLTGYSEFRPHCFARNENGLEWIRTRYTRCASGQSASWAKLVMGETRGFQLTLLTQ